MSSAHQNPTTTRQTFLFEPGSEQHYASTREVVKSNTIERPTTTITTKLSGSNKKEAQFKRKRHKRKLKTRILPFRQTISIWTCANIIICSMIILTTTTLLESATNSPQSSSSSSSSINNNNNSNKSRDVISRSKSSKLISSLLDSKKSCCFPEKPLIKRGIQVGENFSIGSKAKKGLKFFGGNKDEEKESDTKKVEVGYKTMHQREGLLMKKWRNLDSKLTKNPKTNQKEALNDDEDDEKFTLDYSPKLSMETKTLVRLKRSLIEGIEIELEAARRQSRSSSMNKQVVITEKGRKSATSTFTSVLFTSPNNHVSGNDNNLANDTQVNKLSASNNANANANNNSTSFDLNSPNPTNNSNGNSNGNNTQITLSKQQKIQEQAFQRRLMELKQKYMTNRAISDKAYYILLVIYSLFIIVGTISNSLICLTVILKPKILSPRNIFIVNLAGSDLLLCVFTMPFSFIEISMKMWQMGLIPCKLVAGLQATSIFVSTISITAIALDRYKVIVYPTHQESANGTRGAALLLASVWIGALLLSLPLFRFRTVEHLDLPHKYDTIKSIDFCVEAWPFAHGRGIYSVISMMFQYVLPITIVSVVYAKISDKLQKRLIRRQKLTQLECRQKKQLNLIRRTHTMLISVSLIFGLSWLPLNLLNVIGDFSDLFRGDDQLFRVVFAICHLIGCSSACSNPILYGYLNENFRKEFHQVYTYHMHRLARLCRRITGCRLRSGDDDDYDEEEEEEEEDEEGEEEDGEEDEEDEEEEDEEDEEEQDYDGDDLELDDKQFYNKDAGLDQPVTPTSIIGSSNFASDEDDHKGGPNWHSKYYHNNTNAQSFEGQLSSNNKLGHTSSGSQQCHRPLSLTASEEGERKSSLPLLSQTNNRIGGPRNSSASLKANQLKSIDSSVIDYSGQKLAQSCILELAESCANISRTRNVKSRKFFNFKQNRSAIKVTKKAAMSTNDQSFKAPELKLFPPPPSSAATRTSPRTSSAMMQEKNADLESSVSRRYSFQALSNSRHNLGKTMRFCLCVSNESLVESDADFGGVSGTNNAAVNVSRGVVSPNKSGNSRKRGLRKDSRDQLMAKSGSVRGEQLDCSSLAIGQKQLINNKRRRKRPLRAVSPANCDCNCHKSVQIESSAPAVNINQERRKSSSLLQPPPMTQQQQQKRFSGKEISHSNKDFSHNKERQGRRVWLRFFPDRQQTQERYDCMTSINTLTIQQQQQQCNGEKLMPIKSQSDLAGLTTTGRKQSIKKKINKKTMTKSKNKKKNENDENDGDETEEAADEEEEEEEEDNADVNNSNAVCEQTKALNDPQPNAISSGKQKNKQLEDLQVRAGRKQHCANCKHGGSGGGNGAAKTDRKKIRTQRKQRKGGSASSSRKNFLRRENIDKKLAKEIGTSGSFSRRNNEATICGFSNKSSPHSMQATMTNLNNKKDLKSPNEWMAESQGRIEGLKVAVGDSMNGGGSNEANCYYLSVETARSRGGSDVSKEQSTELVVINGDVDFDADADAVELEPQAKVIASSASSPPPSFPCKSSPSLLKSSSHLENRKKKRGEQEAKMLDQKSGKFSIDVHSTMPNKINNMQNSSPCSDKTNINNNNHVDDNDDKNNFHPCDYNGRLRMQITTTTPTTTTTTPATTTSEFSRPLGQADSGAGLNANVANNRGENVGQVSCKCGNSSGCQMSYRGLEKRVCGEKGDISEKKMTTTTTTTMMTGIGCVDSSDSVEAIKKTSLSLSAKSTISIHSDNTANFATTRIHGIVGPTLSLSALPDTLMTDPSTGRHLEARLNHLQEIGHHRMGDTDSITNKTNNNNNENNNKGHSYDVCVTNNNNYNNSDVNAGEKLPNRKQVVEAGAEGEGKLRNTILKPNSLTKPSMDCPISLLGSDSSSSSCACLQSQSSSCTCSISSACRREISIHQPEQAITSCCNSTTASAAAPTTTTTTTATTITTTTKIASTINATNSSRQNRNNRTCISIGGIIKKDNINNNNQLAIDTRPFEATKWASCTNSARVHSQRESSNKQMVSSSLSALPGTPSASALVQSLVSTKANTSNSICQVSASTSCSGSNSGSNSASISVSSASVSISSSATTNSISRSSLASNDEFTFSSSSSASAAAPVVGSVAAAGGVALAGNSPTTLDSAATSSASLEVARVMVGAEAITSSRVASKCPALSRMAKQSRKLSVTSFGTSTDLVRAKAANVTNSNVSLQPLTKQCNGSFASSQSDFCSPVMTTTTAPPTTVPPTTSDTDNQLGENQLTLNHDDTLKSMNDCEEQTDSGQAEQKQPPTHSLMGFKQVSGNSSDAVFWQRFGGEGGKGGLTKSQEEMIIVERKRF